MSNSVIKTSARKLTKPNVPEKSKTANTKKELQITKNKKEEELKVKNKNAKEDEKLKKIPKSSIKVEQSAINAPKTTPKSSNDLPKQSSSKPTIKNPLNTYANINKSKVTHNQYFPSKNLYSNALKATRSDTKTVDNRLSNRSNITSTRSTISLEKDKDGSEKDRKSETEKIRKIYREEKSRNKKSINTKLNISKNKRNQNDSSPESSTISERPRTATLRKPSIVNANIVGPEAPKFDIQKSIEKTQSLNAIKIESAVEDSKLTVSKIEIDDAEFFKSSNNSDQYESDFESYESDFEKYSSSNDSDNIKHISGEETSSTSSSVAENSENSSKSGSPSTPVQIKTPLSMEYEKKLDSGTFDLGDFRYKHMLGNIQESIDFENSKITQNIQNNSNSLSDEGFEDQKSLQFINFADAQKKCERKKESAKRKKRGTEILSMIRLDVVNFTIFDLLAISYEEYIASYGNSNTMQTTAQTGEDNISEESQTDLVEINTRWTQMPSCFSNFDMDKSINFWTLYKDEYLGVGVNKDNTQKEKENFKHNKIIDFDEQKLLKFLTNSGDLVLNILAEENIKNVIKINQNKRNLPFSNGYIQFNTSQDIFKHTRVGYIAIYQSNINKFLTVHITNQNLEKFGSVVCIWDISDFEKPQYKLISYGQISCCTFFSDFILAGEVDGSVSVWNIKSQIKLYDITDRSPSFRTTVGKGHSSKVVAIQSFQSDQSLNGNKTLTAVTNCEVCTLDQDGNLLFWNLFPNSPILLTLMNTERIQLYDIFPDFKDLQCTDMILDKIDVYISTNYGFILHYVVDGARCKVKMFSADSQAESTCLEFCPFSPTHFISGYSDGNISIFAKNCKKPLKTLSNKDDLETSKIHMVRWSKTRPFVIYAKDVKNVVHIWDLSKSEVYPEFSVPFDEEITGLKLSPLVKFNEEKISYMIIGTETAKIYLHILNQKYGQENLNDYENEANIFLNYVNRL